METKTKAIIWMAIAGVAIRLFSSVGLAKPPGNYPNFTGAGVHENPALILQDGNWNNAELGLQTGVPSSLLEMNRRLGRSNDCVNIKHARINGIENNIFTAAAMPMHELAFGVSEESAGDTTFGLGLVLNGENSLTRAGVTWTPETKFGSAAAEWRVNTGKSELTLSLKKEFTKIGGKLSGQDTKAGIQLKKGDGMLSFGVSGPKRRDLEMCATMFDKQLEVRNLWITFPNANLKKAGFRVGVRRAAFFPR